MKMIGFTGTRLGMTDAQRDRVQLILRNALAQGVACTLVHGGCTGADEQADRIAAELGIPRHVRPAMIARYRATLAEGALVVAEPKLPLERNRDIVEDVRYLIACPDGPERVRSGTWSTVRHARWCGRRIAIVWPDGKPTLEICLDRRAIEAYQNEQLRVDQAEPCGMDEER